MVVESMALRGEELGADAICGEIGSSIRDIEPSTLVDVKGVVIDRNLSKKERMSDFVRQIKNPYLYRCGKVVVGVSFSDGGETLEDLLKHHFLTLQQ